MECVPYSKVGGMADVVGALPKALAEHGCLGGTLSPWYPQATTLKGPPIPTLPKAPKKKRSKKKKGRAADVPAQGVVVHAEFPIEIGGTTHNVRLLRAGEHDLLVDLPAAFDRAGVYADPETGEGYADSLFRCLVLQQTARVALREGHIRADLVHCHDNHTGLLPAFLQDDDGPPSVFTIHNLAYQGVYEDKDFLLTGMDPSRFVGHSAFEFHGNFSLMKTGLVLANKVTTVSPGYADEVLGEEDGQGLDGVLRGRGEDFVGILNGIDMDAWNPATDAFLDAVYSADDVAGKSENKRALQERTGLDVDAGAPLFGVVSRITAQKGLDMLGPLLPWLVERGGQFVILGTGDPSVVEIFRNAQERWPQRVALVERYDEAEAHRIYAASDFFCMPSRFEPCGLTQMYAMRYGAVPIVTARGGLRDTVPPYSEETPEGTGILSTWATTDSYAGAVDYALKLFADGTHYERARSNGMTRNFSWHQSAAKYLDLYRSILGQP